MIILASITSMLMEFVSVNLEMKWLWLYPDCLRFTPIYKNSLLRGLESQSVLYYFSFTAHFICNLNHCLLQLHLVSPFRWRCAKVWAIISPPSPTYGSPLLIREMLLICFISTVYVRTLSILLVMFNALHLFIYPPHPLWPGADGVAVF